MKADNISILFTGKEIDNALLVRAKEYVAKNYFIDKNTLHKLLKVVLQDHGQHLIANRMMCS